MSPPIFAIIASLFSPCLCSRSTTTRRFRDHLLLERRAPGRLYRRICAHADDWREVRALDDDALCRVIRDDGIDVLVDLDHAHGQRSPAGLRAQTRARADRLARLSRDDRHGRDRLPAERSAPRPGGLRRITTPNARCACRIRSGATTRSTDPPAGRCSARRSSAVISTLGCLNNPCKLTDRTLRALERRDASAADGSGSAHGAAEGRHRRRLTRAARRREASIADRVEFVAFRPRADYLRTYHDASTSRSTLSLQRPHHEPRCAVDGRAHRHARRRDLRRPRRVEPAPSARVFSELAAHSDDAFVDVAAALARGPAETRCAARLAARAARALGPHGRRALRAPYRKRLPRGLDALLRIPRIARLALSAD